MEKARSFLSVLEEREKLMALLPEGDARFSVRIGPETGMPEMADCSVVTASYQVGADHHGFISVIGPTRMPYARMMDMMSMFSRELTAALSVD